MIAPVLYISRRMTPEFPGSVAKAVQFTGENTEELGPALAYSNVEAFYDPEDKTVSIVMDKQPRWLLQPGEWVVTEFGKPPILSFLSDAAFQVAFEPLKKQEVYH